MHSFLFPLVGFAAVALAQYRTNVPIDNRTLAQIYDAAQAENVTSSTRPLRVFFGGDAGDQGNAIRTAWASAFPKIPLNLTVDLSKYHDGRVDRAHFAGVKDGVADIAVMQTLHDFDRWKRENRLLYYKPPNFADLLQTEKDFDGAYVPVFIASFGQLYYDKTKISASELPTSYTGFTDPKWKGKLVLTYPNDDDAIAFLFSQIVSHHGVGWLEALAANDVQWVRGTGTPVLHLQTSHNTTNDSSLAVTFTSFQIPAGAEGYLSIAYVQPPEQQMSWAQTGAIIRSTPRPEAAKLFLAWLTGQQFQAGFVAGVNDTVSQGTAGSTLESINAAAGIDLYGSDITQITKYRNFAAERGVVEWWKNIYEDILGTPQGPGPLILYPNPPYKA